MDQETFERVLTEEGIDDKNLRGELWHSRQAGELDESRIRSAARELKRQLPELLVRQALNRAMDPLFGRGL
ncbi:MAG: hypothetical protein HYW90_02545 [Candidatus Sungbacteria bacterium]|nr:hypothetical protein [Candidatus Sungbacteria bacterium]